MKDYLLCCAVALPPAILVILTLLGRRAGYPWRSAFISAVKYVGQELLAGAIVAAMLVFLYHFAGGFV